MSSAETSGDTHQRLIAAAPLIVLGLVSIVAGGLVAAIAGALPAGTDTAKLSWATAYLVLVAGVAAIGFGVGQAFLARRIPKPGLVWTELVLYYAGNAAILAGAFADQPFVADAGGLLLVIAIVAFIVSARGRREAAPRWLLYTYRAILVIILVSTPIGLVMSHLQVP